MEKTHHQRNCENGGCILPETTCPTEQGVPCNFPFTFQGVRYGQCTNAGHDKPWCSIGHVPNGIVCKECWKNETYTWGNCISGENDENCLPDEDPVDPDLPVSCKDVTAPCAFPGCEDMSCKEFCAIDKGCSNHWLLDKKCCECKLCEDYSSKDTTGKFTNFSITIKFLIIF